MFNFFSRILPHASKSIGVKPKNWLVLIDNSTLVFTSKQYYKLRDSLRGLPDISFEYNIPKIREEIISKHLQQKGLNFRVDDIEENSSTKIKKEFNDVQSNTLIIKEVLNAGGLIGIIDCIPGLYKIAELSMKANGLSPKEMGIQHIEYRSDWHHSFAGTLSSAQNKFGIEKPSDIMFVTYDSRFITDTNSIDTSFLTANIDSEKGRVQLEEYINELRHSSTQSTHNNIKNR